MTVDRNERQAEFLQLVENWVLDGHHNDEEALLIFFKRLGMAKTGKRLIGPLGAIAERIA